MHCQDICALAGIAHGLPLPCFCRVNSICRGIICPAVKIKSPLLRSKLSGLVRIDMQKVSGILTGALNPCSSVGLNQIPFKFRIA